MSKLIDGKNEEGGNRVFFSSSPFKNRNVVSINPGDREQHNYGTTRLYSNFPHADKRKKKERIFVTVFLVLF